MVTVFENLIILELMMWSVLRAWKNHYKFYNSNEFIENTQTKWEFLKYEIRKFTIDYSKTIAKKKQD